MAPDENKLDAKTPDNPSNRLHELIHGAVAGELSDAELSELDTFLRADPAALETYLKCCQLEIDLRFQTRAALVGRRALADVALDQASDEQSDN